MKLSDQKKAIRKIGWDIKKMSFIIGAGFSKNISKLYLSWWELMQDMVYQMYTPEMKTNNMSVGDIIDKYGYLGIASEYVRRKGYHEAIDDYIEKRTPYLIRNGEGGYDIVLNGRTIERNVDMSLHKTLLKLMPKNIFTFNYDNALEHDPSNIYDPRKSEDKARQEELDYLQNIVRKDYKEFFPAVESSYYAYKRDNLTSQASNKTNLTSAIDDFRTNVINKAQMYIPLPDINPEADPIRQCRIIRDLIYDRVNELSNEISNYRNNKNTYLLITASTDISINKYDHSIYKLHGTLRNYDADKHTFTGNINFDHDHHAQYVITQEDYDAYATNHEAFVDLMRISLLRDSFCIIGFSCDDPNFLLWINWVKDINDLAKERKENTGSKYYINVDCNYLPDDKQLMLENHGIDIINLFDVYPECNKPKDRLIAFFDDLKSVQDSSYMYRQLWQESSLFVSAINKNDIKYNSKHIRTAWKDTMSKPLSFIGPPFNHYRLWILRCFNSLIKYKLINADIVKLYYMATNRSNLPFTSSIPVEDRGNEAFSKIDDQELAIKIAEDVALQNLLNNGSYKKNYINDDLLNHYEFLRRLINFDYSDLDDFLKRWKPIDKLGYVLKQRLLNPDSDILGKVSEWVKEEGYRDPQEYLLALTIINLYGWNVDYSDHKDLIYKKIPDKIKSLKEENPNLISYYDYIKEVCSQLSPKEEVAALGESKITVKFDYYNQAGIAATKIINFIAKLGLSPENIISKEDWILVVNNSYITYPAACLYYSTLYSDRSLIKAIAQLYTYDTTNISNDFLLSSIQKLLKACISYRRYVNVDTLCTFARYFIKRIDSNNWKEAFKLIFNDFYRKSQRLNQGRDEWQIHDGVATFIETGLARLEDDSLKEKIAVQILNKKDYITYFDSNLLVACKKAVNNDNDVKNSISSLTRINPTLPIAMVILNYKECLSWKTLNNWLRKLPPGIACSKWVLPSFAKLSQEHSSLRSHVFSLLDHCIDLWSTGVTLSADEERVTEIGDTNCLFIQSIEEYIKLPDEQILKAYAKLKRSIREIEKAVNGDWVNEMEEWWSTMLVSMNCFLRKYEVVLSKDEAYKVVIKKTVNLYKNISGYSSVTDKLLSGKARHVREAVHELQMEIVEEGIEKHAFEFHVLLSLIINHRGKSIGTCLDLIVWLIKNHFEYMSSGEIMRSLSVILDRFYRYFDNKESLAWDIDAEKDKTENSLLAIRDFLNTKGTISETWQHYMPVFIKTTV